MKRVAMVVLALGTALSGVAVADVASVEEATSKHMVAQAMLTAHFIDAALQAGYSAEEINWILRKVAAQSVITEFWISGSESVRRAVGFSRKNKRLRRDVCSMLLPCRGSVGQLVVELESPLPLRRLFVAARPLAGATQGIRLRFRA